MLYPSSPTVRLFTLGCKVNQCDAEEIARALAARGYRVLGRGMSADVYVVNTCTVTGTADAKARKLIHLLAREHPEATLVVTGCLAQRAPEAMAALEGVDAVVPNTQKASLPDVIASLRPASGGPAPRPETTRGRAFVKLQDGCDHQCAYCAVPGARGEMRSKPFAEALAEMQCLADLGTPEVVLGGIRLGAYGRDSGEGELASFLRDLRSRPIPRIRLSSIEPMDVTDAFLEEIADHPRLCHHLHLPLQSGDDGVLAAMGRTYTSAQFAALVARLRATWPDLGLSTDVLVGFPGEAEEAHRGTLDFVREQRFSRLHVFPYSPRPGTPAGDRPDLPAATKQARAAEMLALADTLAEEAARAWVGRPVSVLFESRDGEGRLTGLTEQYLRLRTEGAAGRIGEIVTLTPTSTEAGELRA